MPFTNLSLLKAGGTALDAAGDYLAAKAQSQSLSNAGKTALARGLAARESARRQSFLLRRQGRQLAEGMVNDAAANGIAMEGTPVDVLSASIANLEMDRIVIEQEGERAYQEAYHAYRQYKRQAKNAKLAGYIKMAGGAADFAISEVLGK